MSKQNPEDRILHETDNMYLWRGDDGAPEIRLNATNGVYSVVVGKSPDVASARRTMERLERDIRPLRKFLACP